jgi:hypothetical protein
MRDPSQLDLRQIFADNDVSGKIAGDFLHKPVEHALVLSEDGGGSERASLRACRTGVAVGFKQVPLSEPLLSTVMRVPDPIRGLTHAR